MTARLDAFTDAAFAFAVTLLVIGGSEASSTYEGLAAAVADVPTFAIGFAIIAMFWFAHVRWRSYRGDGDWLSVLLSLLLIFLVLVYIQPLRAMARSLASFMGGEGRPFVGDLGDLFVIYGAGFVAMSLATAGLFAESLRGGLDRAMRAVARGEMFIWLILSVTGLLSILLAGFEATGRLAPWAHATLALSIGLFTARYDWTGGAPPAPELDNFD
ncbi:MAG TPA: TMEM175 family protein [Allosphingosinicella sp.]